MKDPCEWDPERDVPTAGTYDNSTREWSDLTGCSNRSELIVGANGQWRLCRSCAALPRFKRYRVRKEIRR